MDIVGFLYLNYSLWVYWTHYNSVKVMIFTWHLQSINFIILQPSLAEVNVDDDQGCVMRVVCCMTHFLL